MNGPQVGGSATNWILRDNSLAHRDDGVELIDGRTGIIDGVDPAHGWPVVHIDGTTARVAMHPARDIARRVPAS